MQWRWNKTVLILVTCADWFNYLTYVKHAQQHWIISNVLTIIIIIVFISWRWLKRFFSRLWFCDWNTSGRRRKVGKNVRVVTEEIFVTSRVLLSTSRLLRVIDSRKHCTGFNKFSLCSVQQTKCLVTCITIVMQVTRHLLLILTTILNRKLLRWSRKEQSWLKVQKRLSKIQKCNVEDQCWMLVYDRTKKTH